MEPNLRKIIEGPAERDAIHIAIVPLKAGKCLGRGMKVKLAFGTEDVALDADYCDDMAIGVVSPFLDEYCVNEGELFWCLLYPGTVTGLRHEWTHPAFARKAFNEHEFWLRQFADKWNFDYEEMIDAGTSKGVDRYVTARGIDLHSASEVGSSDLTLFWYHIEKLVGKEFNERHRDEMGWSCSC